MGLINKYKKNKIRWAGPDSIHRNGNKRQQEISEIDVYLQQEYTKLTKRVKELQEQEVLLDQHLSHIEGHRQSLKRDKMYANYAYLYISDFEVLHNARD